MKPEIKHEQSETQIVAKALINTKLELSLTTDIVGLIIGADSSTINHIIQNKDMPKNQVYEAAVLLIRLYRSLHARLGGDKGAMMHWLNSNNKDFNGEKPVDVIKSQTGLVEIVHFLEAIP